MPAIFLTRPKRSSRHLQPVAERGARGHLVEICDPLEEIFPYSGRQEFLDPESGERLKVGRAENFGDDYRALFIARREELRAWAARFGWSYTVNRTDRQASECLAKLQLFLSEDRGLAA